MLVIDCNQTKKMLVIEEHFLHKYVGCCHFSFLKGVFELRV